jgi:hypothetical protein
MLVALSYTTPTFATGVAPKVDLSQNDEDRSSDIDFSESLYDYRDMPEIRWEDSVMMTKLPAGSLIVKYDGPQKILIKHARSQVRRYARRYSKYSEGAQPQIDVWNQNVDLSAWWTRSWMASMPSSKGGAPDQPYVHTIGSEITWDFGPLTFSNMLKVKIDYVAVLKWNPDPGERTSERDPPPSSFDVKPTRAASIGSRFKVKVKPIIRLGMPKEGWISTIRSLALQADIDIVVFGVRFISGEVLLKYEPAKEHELTLTFGFSITSW